MTNTNTNMNATVVSTETKKVTKKEHFKTLLALVEEASIPATEKSALSQFIERELDLLAKKSNAGGSRATKELNDRLSVTIVEVLKEMGEPVTVSQLMEDNRLATYEATEKGNSITKKMSSQKLSALLSKMVKEGSVVKEKDSKKSLFSAA